MAKNIKVANAKRRKKGARKKPRKKRPHTKRRRRGAGEYKTGVPANRMMESNQYWQLRAEIAGGESKVRTTIKERQDAEDKKDEELRKLRTEVDRLKDSEGRRSKADDDTLRRSPNRTTSSDVHFGQTPRGQQRTRSPSVGFADVSSIAGTLSGAFEQAANETSYQGEAEAQLIAERDAARDSNLDDFKQKWAQFQSGGQLHQDVVKRSQEISQSQSATRAALDPEDHVDREEAKRNAARARPPPSPPGFTEPPAKPAKAANPAFNPEHPPPPPEPTTSGPTGQTSARAAIRHDRAEQQRLKSNRQTALAHLTSSAEDVLKRSRQRTQPVTPASTQAAKRDAVTPPQTRQEQLTAHRKGTPRGSGWEAIKAESGYTSD